MGVRPPLPDIGKCSQCWTSNVPVLPIRSFRPYAGGHGREPFLKGRWCAHCRDHYHGMWKHDREEWPKMKPPPKPPDPPVPKPVRRVTEDPVPCQCGAGAPRAHYLKTWRVVCWQCLVTTPKCLPTKTGTRKLRSKGEAIRIWNLMQAALKRVQHG